VQGPVAADEIPVEASMSEFEDEEELSGIETRNRKE
jgi:hypothetical protein